MIIISLDHFFFGKVDILHPLFMFLRADQSIVEGSEIETVSSVNIATGLAVKIITSGMKLNQPFVQ